jgi:hypothetical protein
MVRRSASAQSSSKFKEGDRVYCTQSEEWGEVLEFLGEGLVRIQLEGYEPCLRLSHDLTKKPSHKHKSDRVKTVEKPKFELWETVAYDGFEGQGRIIEGGQGRIVDFKWNHALIESNEQQFFVELSALRKVEKVVIESEELTIEPSNLGDFVQPSLLSLIPKKSKKKRSNSSRHPSGSLYSFIQNKKNKSGQVLTYPKVEGQRDRNNDRHWFWAYCYDEKTDDGWKSRKRSVPVEKLALVRKAIADNKPIDKILKLI